MEKITSAKNPRVLRWRSLKDRKGRKETSCFLAEGRKMAEEALKSGFACEALLLTEELFPLFDPPEDVPVFILAEHVFEAVCDTKTPQGVAAVMRMRQTELPRGRIAVLDGVQDPGNVGTIIRTADAAGFDGVLLSGDCADPYSPKTLRATMGSVFHLPVVIREDLPGALRAMRNEGYELVSTQLDGQLLMGGERYPDRLALIIGSEGNGVSEEVRSLATRKVLLPMRGRAESLNAAVAAGIMMYEVTRGMEV